MATRPDEKPRYHKFAGETMTPPTETREPGEWGGIIVMCTALLLFALVVAAVYIIKPHEDKQDVRNAKVLAQKTLVRSKAAVLLFVSAEEKLHRQYGRYSGRAAELVVVEPGLERVFGAADANLQTPGEMISFAPIFDGAGYQATLSWDSADIDSYWVCKIIRAPHATSARAHCDATGQGYYANQMISRSWRLTVQ